jgi:hypothetical protein
LDAPSASGGFGAHGRSVETAVAVFMCRELGRSVAAIGWFFPASTMVELSRMMASVR